MEPLSTTTEDLKILRDKVDSSDRFGMDYETTASDGSKEGALAHDLLRVIGVGFGFEDGTTTYVPIAHTYGDNAPREEVIELLEYVLTHPDKEMWAHNLKFEYLVSRSLGITPTCKLRCSMIAQWLLGYRLDKGRGLKLKASVQKFLRHKMTTWEEVVPRRTKAQDVLPAVMGAYCTDDAYRCLQLGMHFIPELTELDLMDVFVRLEMEFLPVLVHMQEVGFALDSAYLSKLNLELSEEMESLGARFKELTGVGISKNAQISRRLYEELQWWPSKGFEKGRSGLFSINKGHLEWVEAKLEKDTAPMEALLLKRRYQEISKLNSTYTLSLVDRAEMHLDERLRGSFNQCGTDTGRLSSSGPNLQNIPVRSTEGRKIRDAFIAAPGWVLCVADYSQADLVMMAHLSQDPMLMKAYLEFLDLHQQTADECARIGQVEVTRPMGKIINLGLIYEMMSGTLSKNLGVHPRIGDTIHRAWHITYPGVRVYQERMHAYARHFGYVKTITGRIRRIPEINSRNGMRRSTAEKAASNTPDQGSVADVIKIAKRNLYREWLEKGILYDYYTGKGKAKILSQVHDEVVCEFKLGFEEQGMADLRRHLETAVELRVPMVAQPGIGDTWNTAKSDVKRREEIAGKAQHEQDPDKKAEMLRRVMAVA